jgi:hypothetical protein
VTNFDWPLVQSWHNIDQISQKIHKLSLFLIHFGHVSTLHLHFSSLLFFFSYIVCLVFVSFCHFVCKRTHRLSLLLITFSWVFLKMIMENTMIIDEELFVFQYRTLWLTKVSVTQMGLSHAQTRVSHAKLEGVCSWVARCRTENRILTF